MTSLSMYIKISWNISHLSIDRFTVRKILGLMSNSFAGLECPSLPRISNGRLLVQKPFLFDQSAQLICNDGFEPDGVAEVGITCSDWWPVSQHSQCSLASMNDEIYGKIESISLDFNGKSSWKIRAYFGMCILGVFQQRVKLYGCVKWWGGHRY